MRRCVHCIQCAAAASAGFGEKITISAGQPAPFPKMSGSTVSRYVYLCRARPDSPWREHHISPHTDRHAASL